MMHGGKRQLCRCFRCCVRLIKGSTRSPTTMHSCFVEHGDDGTCKILLQSATKMGMNRWGQLACGLNLLFVFCCCLFVLYERLLVEEQGNLYTTQRQCRSGEDRNILLKEHIMLGHADIVDDSVSFCRYQLNSSSSNSSNSSSSNNNNNSNS